MGAAPSLAKAIFRCRWKEGLSTKAEPEAFAFHANIRGTSLVSCGEERIALTLGGDGPAGRFGAMTTALRHEVGNTLCQP